PRWLTGPMRKRLDRAQRFVGDTATALIAKRRRRGGGGSDLLGALLEAADEHGALSEQQLRTEVMHLYLASFETTGSALAWTLWLLATHPRIRTALQDEIDAGEGQGDEPGRTSLLQACIYEGLRLFPPVPLIPRRTVADHVLGGHLVRAQTPVLVSPWLIHHDPALWPDPDAFDPHRFTSGGLADPSRPRLAWVP